MEHSFIENKHSEVYVKSKACKDASINFQLTSSIDKNKILFTLSNLILEYQEEILENNLLDINHAKSLGYTNS